MPTMQCQAHPLGGGTLTCTLTAGHAHGHVYVAAWAPDGRHDDITQEG